MTISTQLAVKRYDGDGATTSFPTEFKFLQNGHVQVILVDGDGMETIWAENTQYTLTGAGSDSGGTVEVATSPNDYTPQIGEALVITRVVPEIQESDYPEGGAFPAAAHEQALDLLTMMVQKHSEEIVRSLVFPIGDPDAAVAALPNAPSRASRFLAFDSAGKPIAAVPPDGGNVVSAFIAAMLDDADAAAARSTLGLGTVSQAEAEAGTATITRSWTAERGAQAVASLTPPPPEFTTGDAKLTLKAVADAGWVLMDDGTIGSAASGATARANADTEPLYTLIWNNVSDTHAPVAGGRGASAAADFAADKPIALTKQLGRTLAVAGAGAGLTTRALGDALGEEGHVQTANELVGHSHDSGVGLVTGTADGGGGAINVGTGGSIINTGTTGGSPPAPMNIIQPTAFWNVIIKL